MYGYGELGMKSYIYVLRARLNSPIVLQSCSNLHQNDN